MPAEPTRDITPNFDGGILKTLIKAGESFQLPGNGVRVKIHYTGRLSDGSIFETTTNKARVPFEFELGTDSVIKAFDIGVATMKKGEVASFECKPEYAYGKKGNPPKVPPNATLTYQIEMLGWRTDMTPERNGGIMKTILRPGEGIAIPNEGGYVNIHMTGEYDGRVFEDRDVKFPLGEGMDFGVCVGIEKGLEKIKQNEMCRLDLKYGYAFGAKGKPEFGIPPFADVSYTITLYEFETRAGLSNLRLKLFESSYGLFVDVENADDEQVLSFKDITQQKMLNMAEECKERGTRYIQAGKYALAAKVYRRIQDYIGKDIGFDDEQREQQERLLKAMHLNMALCYLKTDMNEEAKKECNQVLDKEPDNEKALFRRGQSYLNANEPEIALQDFERVLQINPKNGAAIKCIQECKDMKKTLNKQQKNFYSNMIGKLINLPELPAGQGSKFEQENPLHIYENNWDM